MGEAGFPVFMYLNITYLVPMYPKINFYSIFFQLTINAFFLSSFSLPVIPLFSNPHQKTSFVCILF